MKRLLLLVPLAGCPHGGAKSPALNELYGGLFEQQRQWTYDVTDADASYQVSCQVTDQRDFTDGKSTVLTCDGEFGEGNPVLAGLWVTDARGLWYLPDVEVEDLADLPSLPKDRMTADTRVVAEPCATLPTGKICFADGGITSGEVSGITFVEAAE